MITIAVINTSVETLEVLQEILEDEGYSVVTAYIVDFKRNVQDLETFFQTYQPAAVVYDIALPYVENWNFFQEYVLQAGYVSETGFVLTTTNKSVLEGLVGATQAIELVGRPFDLELIIQAVHRVVSTG